MPDCSNCGAPLPENSLVCNYCHTRNSVDLRGIGGWTKSDETAQRACPCCNIPLSTVAAKVEKPVHIERCDQCHGLFFDPSELPYLVENSVKNVFEVDWYAIDRLNETRARVERERHYIRCPVCHELMNQINYGKRSGVIVDWCKPHGIWLDSGELQHILEWSKAGGKQLENNVDDLHVDHPIKSSKAPRQTPLSVTQADPFSSQNAWITESHVASEILDSLLSFFRR